jgi:hypothetical protein
VFQAVRGLTQQGLRREKKNQAGEIKKNQPVARNEWARKSRGAGKTQIDSRTGGSLKWGWDPVDGGMIWAHRKQAGCTAKTANIDFHGHAAKTEQRKPTAHP